MTGCRDPGLDSGALQQNPFAAAGASFGATAVLGAGYQGVQGAPPPSAGYQGFAYQGIANSVGAAGPATVAPAPQPLFSSTGPLAISPAEQGGGGGFPPAAVPASSSVPIASASQGKLCSSLTGLFSLETLLSGPKPKLGALCCPFSHAFLQG